MLTKLKDLFEKKTKLILGNILKKINKDSIFKNGKWYFIYSFILIVALIFTYVYVCNEDPLYVYDYSGYWYQFKNSMTLLFADFHVWIETTINSIRTLDYNPSSIIFLFPVYLFFGSTRLSYITGLVVMYVVPIIFITIKYCYNKIFVKDKLFLLIIIFCSLLYTRYWSPTIRGLSDIIGVFPLVIVMIYYFKNSFNNKLKFYQPILIGTLIYLPFLFRRWYIYSIIGFYFSIFFISFFDFIKSSDKKNQFIILFKNFLLSSLTTLLAALICQLPLLKRIITENYSNAYEAFQGSIKTHILNFYYEFGFVIIIFSLIGLIFMIKNPKYKKIGIYNILYIVICYLSFSTVQMMGLHHYLAISFNIIVLFIFGVYSIYSKLLSKKYRICYSVIIIALSIINFSSVYIFRDFHIPILTQNNKYYKFRHYNMNELYRLTTDLEYYLNEKNSYYTVLGSNSVISDNLLDIIGSDLIKQRLIYTSHIDQRDGISINALLVDYVVITSIPQYGVNSDGERVISIPNNEIYNKSTIGNAYTRISGPYYLENEVEAFIYKKDREFTLDEVEDYFNFYYKIYPYWKEKYSYFDYSLTTSKISLGAIFGKIFLFPNNTLYMHPGYTNTIWKIPVNKKIDKMKLKIYVQKIDNLKNDEGIVELTIKQDKKTIYDKLTISSEEKYITLNLKETNSLEFNVGMGKIMAMDWLYLEILELE